MVGGAQPAPKFANAVQMVVGSRGSVCSGVAIAPNLVLTAAHCVALGSTYKLLESGTKALRDVASTARHPQFDADAAARHRITADVALVKFSFTVSPAPIPLAPAGFKVAAGDPLLVAGYGMARLGDEKSVGTLRTASLIATGQPGTLQVRLMDPAARNVRAGLGACVGDSGGPAFANVDGGLAVMGVISVATGPNSGEGCGGLTIVTPLVRYRDWIVEQAKRYGSALVP